jgi:hypothetical protein
MQAAATSRGYADTSAVFMRAGEAGRGRMAPITRSTGPCDRMTEATATVIIMAPIFDVLDYLADLRNLLDYVPRARSVARGDGDALTIGYQRESGRAARIAPARLRMSRADRRVDWEIRGSACFCGTIQVYGDSVISQLHSTLRSSRPALSRAVQAQHRAALRRIAQAVESHRHPIPAAIDHSVVVPRPAQIA